MLFQFYQPFIHTHRGAGCPVLSGVHILEGSGFHDGSCVALVYSSKLSERTDTTLASRATTLEVSALRQKHLARTCTSESRDPFASRGHIMAVECFSQMPITSTQQCLPRTPPSSRHLHIPARDCARSPPSHASASGRRRLDSCTGALDARRPHRV